MRAIATEREHDGDGLLTLEEVARLLRVKTSWVYGHIHAKSLPFPESRRSE